MEPAELKGNSQTSASVEETTHDGVNVLKMTPDGVRGDNYIRIDNPFRHRIVIKGSSVTHGLAASRPGMSYAARFGRDNGFYCFNLGFSGKTLT